jgi:hypothetical protein
MNPKIPLNERIALEILNAKAGNYSGALKTKISAKDFLQGIQHI